jgi:hypothetical protein
MRTLNHVKRVANHNIVSGAVSDQTLQRLDRRCAEMDVPRSLVIRDFIELCLDICDGADLADEIVAARKKKTT